jgi:hypothetical protein
MLEIERLKAIINKDSSNSSKPPGSNGFKDVPNSRERSGKSRGGQKGHLGHRLELPDNINELIALGFVERRLVDHTDGSDDYVSKYTLDVEMKTIITEHRFVKDSVPEGFYNEVTYGKNVKALTLMLMVDGMIPHKRLGEFFRSVTHGIVDPSTGTINNFRAGFADKLDKSNELSIIENDVRSGAVICTDDTPLKSLEKPKYSKNDDTFEGYERSENKSLRITLRTYSNNNSTLYTVNPKKDNQGIIRDGILDDYHGTVVCDHESKYIDKGKRNAGCGAHLCRELKGLRDLYKKPWAGMMREFLQRMNSYKNEDLENGIFECDPEVLKTFELEYDEIVAKGSETLKTMLDIELGYSKYRAMIWRLELEQNKDRYMLFMRDYTIPFTNNLAERDLRAEKTREKISGPFRSWEGAENHCNIRSFMSALKKRGYDLFNSIKKVMAGEPVLNA